MSDFNKNTKQQLLEFIKNHPKTTQKEIGKYLESIDCSIAQPTITRYIKNLRYHKKNGKYVKTPLKARADRKRLLTLIFSYATARIVDQTDTPNQIFIYTTTGTEQIISKLVHELYPKRTLGVFSGSRSVMIVAKSQSDADIIKEKLNSFMGKSTATTSKTDTTGPRIDETE